MSEAFDSDVSVTVEVGFGDVPFDSSVTWTDVTEWCRGLRVSRGRFRFDEVFPAGSLTVTLDNRDGRFDPSNVTGPYFASGVTVGNPIRVRATYDGTTYDLFRGAVQRWPLAYPGFGKDAVASVEAVEELFYLVGFEDDVMSFSAPPSGSMRTDDVIDQVLDEAGWPAGLRALDSGDHTVDHVASWFPTVAAYGSSWTLWGLILEAVQTEPGEVFVAADGSFTFHSRTHHAGGSTSLHTFGPADLPYADVTVAYDSDTLVNQATVVSSIDDTHAYLDTGTTVGTAGPRGVRRVSRFVSSAGDAQNIAENIVLRGQDVSARINGMLVKPQADPSNLWDAVLGLDLRDSVTVNVVPPAGTSLSQKVTIESVSHAVNFQARTWETRFVMHPLSSHEELGVWILGTDLLDTGTILG